MEMRGLDHKVPTNDDCNSAHQYSARSVSLQADSEVHEELELQKQCIDLKNNGNKIDVYDFTTPK